MKLSKESKIKVLENFYGIDYTFFGKSVNKVDTCCPIFIEEYMSVKGALLSLVVEMYKLMNYSPKLISEKVTKKVLFESAIKRAKKARRESKKLVTSKMGRNSVKSKLVESIQGSEEKVNVEKIVQEEIRRKSFSLAVDSMLIGSAITESKDYKKLNEFRGKILEDAYKILRNQLVESAMSILDNGSY